MILRLPSIQPRGYFSFMDLDFISVYKNAKKHLGLHQAILTSHLVNNAYAWHMYCIDWSDFASVSSIQVLTGPLQLIVIVWPVFQN